MSKKRKRSVPVAPPKPRRTIFASQEKKMVIDMNEVNRKMQHTVPSFRTGKHMTDKDRPRKKNWKREYEKGRESGRHNDTDPGSFLLPESIKRSYMRYKTEGYTHSLYGIIPKSR